ncbi:Ribokinase-like protein [Pilobolus umbonatus]|nr:Ribokinase-like protein [Pilobolus umbonatus]
MSNLEDDKSCRVLSIQSHMVSGYCGNKAAVFPLQTLGYDVDIVNTVQFSNHTGYPTWTGTKLRAKEVQDLFDGLEENKLIDEYTHVLTGYIGNSSILETIEKMVIKLKKKNPQLKYVCDPVMGEDDEIYVSPDIIPLYKDIMKVVDVLTPNQTEAAVLSDIKITSLDTAKRAAMKLHSMGTPNIVITSLTLPFNYVPVDIQLPDSTKDSLYCFTSQYKEGAYEQYLISFPTYPGYFTGTGDLFSSLVVAWFQSSLIEAVVKVICSVNAVTKRTYEYQKGLEYDSHRCELRVIQGKKDIEEPERVMKEGRIKYIQIK